MKPEIDGLIVSRETFLVLQEFHDLILKWNPRINLVSKSSIDMIWKRHIWDSAQLILLAGEEKNWVDIGSGGGFPALIVAILSKELSPERYVTMVESDQRKSVFLRTAIRQLDLNARVLCERVEMLDCLEADVLSARALADLGQLLGYGSHHLSPQGTAFFLKGEKWEKEVEDARDSWSFNLRAHKSKTNDAAAILEIKEIKRV